MTTGRRRTTNRRYKRRTTTKRTGASAGVVVVSSFKNMFPGQKLVTFDQWCKQSRRAYRANRGLGNP